jgi:hypothetical protein
MRQPAARRGEVSGRTALNDVFALFALLYCRILSNHEEFSMVEKELIVELKAVRQLVR